MRYRFLLPSVLVISCLISCEQKEPSILSDCGNGFVLTADKTACICPTATHYLYNDGRMCHEKTEYSYLVKASTRNCMPGVSSAVFNNDSTGIIWFDPANNFFDITWGPSNTQQPSPHSLRNLAIEKKNDGRVECSFEIGPLYCSECFDWDARTDQVLAYGKAYGVSNPTNTEMDIQIIYTATDNTVLDTGYLHLWKQ